MDDDRSHEKGYSEMGREVNASVVAENEILSDHAYYYNVEKGVLEAV